MAIKYLSVSPPYRGMNAELRRLEGKLTIDILWVYILSMLAKRASHAYALRDAIKKRFSFLPGEVSVYVVLYKLEGRGYVSSRKDRNRKVYSITAKGRTLLKEAKKSLAKKQKLLFG